MTTTTTIEPKQTTKKTHVAICLDKSGSMATMHQEAIDAFNQQVETIRGTKGDDHDVRVSLITFETTAQTTFWNEPVDRLQPLTRETYMPSGMTAMNDAIGQAITRLQADNQNPGEDEAFLVVIISDGHENQSKEFNSARIASLVKDCEATGKWTFTFLGANVDLKEVQKTYGFQAGNVMAFVANSEGMKVGGAANSVGTASYFAARSNGETQTRAFYQK